MQVNFDFAPTRLTMLFQAIDQGSVVLFGGIEVRVAQRLSIIVRPRLNRRRVPPTPSV
jgi:hypothetical protein